MTDDAITYLSRISLDRYQHRKADNTLRAQRAAIVLFGKFLVTTGVDIHVSDLPDNLDSWRGVTWVLVENFVDWMLENGYAMGTVNNRLSIIKTYAKLATRAGVLTPTELFMIQGIVSHNRREEKRINERRERSRVGAKKAKPEFLTVQQVEHLKKQPNTSQGRRDAVIIAFLVEHGLRVGELASLRVEDVDLKSGSFIVYRKNLDHIQTHKLTADARLALNAYFNSGDAPSRGALLRSSTTTGGVHLTHDGMTERSIYERVSILGERIGVDLSPNDLRHTWITLVVRSGTPVDRLRDAGGWASVSSPILHLETEPIANIGVDFSDIDSPSVKRP